METGAGDVLIREVGLAPVVPSICPTSLKFFAAVCADVTVPCTVHILFKVRHSTEKIEIKLVEFIKVLCYLQDIINYADLFIYLYVHIYNLLYR